MEAEPSAARPSRPRAHAVLAHAVPAQAGPAQAGPAQAGPASARVMSLLQHQVPLTLLLDLAWGVRSSEVYAAEPADLSWLRPSAVA